MGIIIFFPEAAFNLGQETIHYRIFYNAENLIGGRIITQLKSVDLQHVPDLIGRRNGRFPDMFVKMVGKQSIKLNT